MLKGTPAACCALARRVTLLAMLRMMWHMMLRMRLCVAFARLDFDLACVALEWGWRCACTFVVLAASSAGVVRRA